ncbi:MAG: BrnT family toxin [Candidatus Omnitrophica bacterium]|nr:BrnT family toxin [Candidatus Omnitrophota bacterium]
MKWDEFIPLEFEYDWEKDKLGEHEVTFEEAVEAFFNDFEIRRNKRFRDRWQLIGRTDSGRRLKIIFQLKSGNVVRIITGWQI